MDERLQGLGSTPISPDSPTGENAKYDELYEQLTDEMAKLESVSGDNPIDWLKVTELSIDVLKSKSKDLLAVSYLAQSLFVKQGLNGLGGGLSVMADMLETYYDDLFPPLKRVKARANAITWLAEKAEPMVSAMNPTVKEFEQFELCLTHLQSVQNVCDEKMGDQGPAIGGLKKALKNWRDHLKVEHDKQQKAAEKAEQAPSEQPQASQASQPAPAPTSTPAKQSAPAMAQVDTKAPMNDDKDVKAAIKSVQDVGRKIAQYKRESDPSDPVAYTLLRTCVWMQIERMPPHDNNVTQLPELDPDRQKLLQNLCDEQSWGDLIKGAESAFCDSFFWLTAHRYVFTALQGLGHQKAAEALAHNVAGFVHRFPGIRNLKFVSGSPFADEMTQVWLDQQLLSSGQGSPGAGESAGWQKGLDDALAAAGKGNAAEGIKLLKQGEREALNERERFMWQLSCAQFLSKTGKVELAVFHLEYLWQKLESDQLCEWESSAAAKIAKALLACYEHKDVKKDLSAQRVALIPELKSIVYRIDIEAVLGAQ